jgi:hypothetical protein
MAVAGKICCIETLVKQYFKRGEYMGREQFTF